VFTCRQAWSVEFECHTLEPSPVFPSCHAMPQRPLSQLRSCNQLLRLDLTSPVQPIRHHHHHHHQYSLSVRNQRHEQHHWAFDVSVQSGYILQRCSNSVSAFALRCHPLAVAAHAMRCQCEPTPSRRHSHCHIVKTLYHAPAPAPANQGNVCGKTAIIKATCKSCHVKSSETF
jgi:hypothetical protein